MLPGASRGAILIALFSAACSPSKGGGAQTAVARPSADPARPLPDRLPEVVARVNGQPIAIGQVLALAKVELSRLPKGEREAALPKVLRGAVEKYVARELLLQEALRRRVAADDRAVEWDYDQMRREHPDEAEWASFLADQGLDPRMLRAELRIKRTVTALLEDEVRRIPIDALEARTLYEQNPATFGAGRDGAPPAFEAVRNQIEARLRQQKQGQVREALESRLRGQARIEILL